VGVSWALAANIMLIAWALYAGLDEALEANLNVAARWISMVLAVPAVLYGAGPFFQRAWASIRHAVARKSPLHLHMDTPISIGILVGFGHSVWATVANSGEIWFDSIAVLIAALLTARWIQFRSKRLAGDAADQLLALIPSMARKVMGDGSVLTVAVSELVPGDIVELPATEVAPVDGTIVTGETHIDNGVITGESAPVRVGTGGMVWAGATNLSRTIRISTTSTRDETKVGKLIAWVQSDKADRAPVTMLADRLSGYFVASVLVLAAVTAAIWLRIDSGLAVSNVVALLVITCPCALGMATPLAMAVGIGRAARHGIFIKSEAAIQSLTEADTVVLDKTGTLTFGRMSVTEVIGDESAVQLAAALESGSTHPIALAIWAFAGDPPSLSPEVKDVHTKVGHGVMGQVDGRPVAVGRLDWIARDAAGAEDFRANEKAFAEHGGTPVAIAVDHRVVCLISIADEIRPDAFRLADELRQRDLEPILCSGDHEATVRHTAQELGIVGSRVFARCEPERKLDIISRLISEDRTVVMIGDGVNDAAALQRADVGVAVSGSSTAGQISSDVFLTDRGVDSVSKLLRGAQYIMRVIKGNLGFSLVYNVAGAAAAMMGIVTPLLAAVAMPVSSLIVVLASSIQRPFS
jgi:Cu2+-exporting ATPase